MELKDVEDWFVLGVYLGLPVSELKIIEANNQHGDHESCKLDMMLKWTDGKGMISSLAIIQQFSILFHL